MHLSFVRWGGGCGGITPTQLLVHPFITHAPAQLRAQRKQGQSGRALQAQLCPYAGGSLSPSRTHSPQVRPPFLVHTVEQRLPTGGV